MNDALSWGITSIHDAKLDQPELDFFHRQALAGNLKVRFHGWKFFEGDLSGYWGNTTERVYGAGNGRWTQRSVKIVADGSLRSRSSYVCPFSVFNNIQAFTRIIVIRGLLGRTWKQGLHARPC